MGRRVRRGELPPTDDDVLAQRYELADARLRDAGFDWYEVSNWSRAGGECRHNIGYWDGGEWWGAGPGAHGYVGSTRWWNVKHPNAYAQALADGRLPVADFEVLDADTAHVEDVMLRLRLRRGCDDLRLWLRLRLRRRNRHRLNNLRLRLRHRLRSASALRLRSRRRCRLTWPAAVSRRPRRRISRRCRFTPSRA